MHDMQCDAEQANTNVYAQILHAANGPVRTVPRQYGIQHTHGDGNKESPDTAAHMLRRSGEAHVSNTRLIVV